MSYNINLPFLIFLFLFFPLLCSRLLGKKKKKNEGYFSPFSPQIKAQQLSLYFYFQGKVESGFICFSNAPCVHACAHTHACTLSHTYTHTEEKQQTLKRQPQRGLIFKGPNHPAQRKPFVFRRQKRRVFLIGVVGF